MSVYKCPNCAHELQGPTTRRGAVPAEVAHNLRALRPDRVRLNWYLATLRTVGGYTLESLAAPLGLTRERVRQRIAVATPVDGVPHVEPPPPPEVIEPVPPPPPIITDDVAKELIELHEVATRLRGSVPADHPYRVAAEALARKFNELHAAGATYREIGEAVGVSAGGVRSRLQHYGYRVLPPSQRRKGGRPRALSSPETR